MSLKNWKECIDKSTNLLTKEKELKGKLIVKEAESDAKDMLIIDLLWLLIDNGIDPIKEGYEDLVTKLGIDYDSKR